MNIEPIREKNLLLTAKFPVLTLNYSDKVFFNDSKSIS